MSNSQLQQFNITMPLFATGKCRCNSDHCYDQKYCRRDVNECKNTTCNGDFICVDVDCVGDGHGSCVGRLSSFEKSCLTKFLYHTYM